MWRPETEEAMHLNWTAILSYSGSLAVSVAIWIGVFRMFASLVK
jgi:hypothetical protein